MTALKIKCRIKALVLLTSVSKRKSAGRKIISHLNRIFARVRQERSVSSVWSIGVLKAVRAE